MPSSMRAAIILGSLAGVWWLLSGGEPASWIIGLPTVIVAGWAFRSLGPAQAGAISVHGLLRFIPFFLWESLRGGVDVALRTLVPKMRIRPGFSQFRTKLRRQDARVFFTCCMGLLPGTLAVELQGDRLEIHLIDVALDADAELGRLERAVARIFPEPL